MHLYILYLYQLKQKMGNYKCDHDFCISERFKQIFQSTVYKFKWVSFCSICCDGRSTDQRLFYGRTYFYDL